MANPVSLQIINDVQQAIKHYSSQPRATAQVVNWYSVVVKFVATVAGVALAANGTQEEKEQAVVDATMAFWRNNLKPLLAQHVNSPWIFNAFIVPTIESEIPSVVKGMYEAIAAMFSSMGQNNKTLVLY